MKTFNYFSIMLIALSLFSCSTEEASTTEINKNPNFRVSENTIPDSYRASYDVPCFTTTLLAGQNYNAGVVTVDTEE